MVIIKVNAETLDLRGPNSLYVEYSAKGPWGEFNDSFVADVSSTSIAQAYAALRNKVIAFAATPQGGAFVLAQNQIWTFGGPQ